MKEKERLRGRTGTRQVLVDGGEKGKDVESTGLEGSATVCASWQNGLTLKAVYAVAWLARRTGGRMRLHTEVSAA